LVLDFVLRSLLASCCSGVLKIEPLMGRQSNPTVATLRDKLPFDEYRKTHLQCVSHRGRTPRVRTGTNDPVGIRSPMHQGSCPVVHGEYDALGTANALASVARRPTPSQRTVETARMCSLGSPMRALTSMT
jgi:hypothetical protein